MIDDIFTVIWKEQRGLFKQRGSKMQAILTLLIPVALFAIVMPWQDGPDWFEGPLCIAASIFVPMLIIGITIPESFAGERERHTLETLLASRLPDRAILFGKMTVSIALAWGVTLLIFLISFIVVNVIHWNGQILFYKPVIIAAYILLSFLFALLTTSIGVRISLRAATVREAQQTLMAAVMFPPLVLGVLGTLVISMEGFRERVQEVMSSINSTLLLIIVTIILVVSCLLLTKAAISRFERGKLILG